MPRRSERHKVLRSLEATIDERRTAAELRLISAKTDRFEDDLDEFYILEHERIEGLRYVARPLTYRKREDQWQKLLDDDTCLNDTEFLEHFRVRRVAFQRIVDLIRDDPIFQSSARRTLRGSAELHPMVLLK